VKYSREKINKTTMMSLFILMIISGIVGIVSTPEMTSISLIPQITALIISIVLFIVVYIKGLNIFVHIGALLFYYISTTSILIFLGTAHPLGLIFLLLISMVTIVTLDGKIQWGLLILLILSFVVISIIQIIAVNSDDIAVYTLAGFLGITLTIIGILLLISQNKYFTVELIETTKSLSRIDHLTKAKNNKALFEDIELLNFDVNRYNHNYCLAFLDIDKFKDINDLYGHVVGDQVLSKFVESMKGQMRGTDEIYRIGGDEFILLFKESKKEEIMKRISDVNFSRFTVEDHEISVAFSFGIVQQTSPPKDLNSLIKDADKLMYLNKHS